MLSAKQSESCVVLVGTRSSGCRARGSEQVSGSVEVGRSLRGVWRDQSGCAAILKSPQAAPRDFWAVCTLPVERVGLWEQLAAWRRPDDVQDLPLPPLKYCLRDSTSYTFVWGKKVHLEI